ncbi:hypothetical protein GCM10010193_48360 [Kitasatospora atroaurantiaca]|uniref:Uncharacterized protein n=1 Tax=Kitasatospora atroaurantiaca TaxID=285545 RepID=A0A561EYV0_9ACTN|nr:hypothetical protein [Kitasatospora atroaurantiaca]TWE20786.1 hypothetical protein FB465_5944 [Kitasatospora atroaurantiaca]
MKHDEPTRRIATSPPAPLATLPDRLAAAARHNAGGGLGASFPAPVRA